jgi:DNA repair protein SbcD/Mre11
MPLKLLHTADLHLGMTHNHRNYPEDLRRQLVESRYETLEGLVESANLEQCRLLVVAGDLFHRANMAREGIIRTVRILSRFEGSCVAILPGNHDFYDPFGLLWKEFLDNAFDGLAVLSETAPYSLQEYGIDAVLYAAPCHRRNSGENRLGWIRELKARPPGRWHIGVAHGSVAGVSPDFDQLYYPMTGSELAAAGLDHWCLGHTHTRYPDLDRAGRQPYLFSGTPEPDGFDCRHGGSAWVTILDEEGHTESRAMDAGRFRFFELERELRCAADLELLKEELRSFGDDILIRLRLGGVLPDEELRGLPGWFRELRQTLAYLEVDHSGLEAELTPGLVAARFADRSFPHRLLSRLIEKEDREALQLAYRLISEVKNDH